MKLLRLSLRFFQCFESLNLEFKGNTNIFAENGKGKTTIFNAVTWLLFEKDSQGKKDFDIKTRDQNGNVIPAVDHSVEAEFDVGGTTITLKRVYKEKYTKPRGKAEQVFDGHVTEHFINGAPKSKGDFQKYIDTLSPEKEFSLLTSPTYFNEILPWQERRRMLVPLCPEITDQSIIDAINPGEELRKLLAAMSIEDAKKTAQADIKKIYEELKVLPSRIDEAKANLPENANGNLQALAEKAMQIASKIAGVKQQIDQANASGNAHLNIELSKIDEAIEKLRADSSRRQMDYSLKVQQEKNRRETAINDSERKVDDLELKHNTEIATLNSLIAFEKKLLREWAEWNEKVFSDDLNCPTCGQSYPEEKKGELIASFNRQKSGQLEAIAQHGFINKENIQQSEQRMNSLKAIIDDAKHTLEAIKNSPANLPEEPVQYTDLPEYHELKNDRDKIQRDIEANAGPGNIVSSLQEQVVTLEQQLKEVNGKISAIELYESIRKRIEQHMAREKELAALLETADKNLFQIEEFYREKSRRLEAGINSMFKLVQFKLFDEQINGGMAECCTCTIGGVPYPSINHSNQIKAGLDIINTLSVAKNFYPPIFIDNAEAVTSFETLPAGQVIKLYVSKGEEGLKLTSDE